MILNFQIKKYLYFIGVGTGSAIIVIIVVIIIIFILFHEYKKEEVTMNIFIMKMI